MECLANFIGIKQVCVGAPVTPPTSGFWIEDYPGITKQALQSIEPGVYLNARTFLDNLTRQAWDTIVGVDARNTLEPYIRMKEAYEFGMLGEFADTGYLEGSAERRGLRVRKSAGVMGVLSIARVWVKSQTAGTFTITVTDGITPKTFTVVTVEDEAVAVWTHYTTERDRVDITITDAAFEPSEGDTSATAEYANCTTCGGTYEFNTLKAQGLYGEEEANDLQGITVEGGLTCDIAPAVCMLAPQLKVPIFYATVIKVLENWEATSRMNFFAQHKAEWVAATYRDLVDTKYPVAWDLHSKGLAAFASRLDSLCIDCGTGTHGGYGTP